MSELGNNNPLFRAMARLGNLVVFSVLWLLCCDIQHQQSQQRQHGQPGCGGLFPVPFERLQEFFAGRYFLPQATAYSARVGASR